MLEITNTPLFLPIGVLYVSIGGSSPIFTAGSMTKLHCCFYVRSCYFRPQPSGLHIRYNMTDLLDSAGIFASEFEVVFLL